jgi:hypothetical protein
MHRLALNSIRVSAILAATFCTTTSPLSAQVATGSVISSLRVTEDGGGFFGNLEKEDKFGSAVTNLGLVNGDSIPDIAVGTRGNDDGGSSAGGVWVLRMSATGSSIGAAEISDLSLGGGLDSSDQFGISVAGLGDRDNDNIGDMAVGANGDDDGGPDRGAVWLVNLTTLGTAKSFSKISDTAGGFSGGLANADNFGAAVANIGDVDGDGVIDIAVGATGDDTGGISCGAIWIVYLNADGSAKGQTKIANGSGGLALDNVDFFGTSIASLGDIDGDGIGDLRVDSYAPRSSVSPAFYLGKPCGG